MCEIELLSIESIRLRAKVSVTIVTNSGQNVIVSAHLYLFIHTIHQKSPTTKVLILFTLGSMAVVMILTRGKLYASVCTPNLAASIVTKIMFSCATS